MRRMRSRLRRSRRYWWQGHASRLGPSAKHNAYQREGAVPEIVVDDRFVDDSDNVGVPDHMRVLVMKECKRGGNGATAVVQKGADEKAVGYAQAFVESQGHRRVFAQGSRCLEYLG